MTSPRITALAARNAALAGKGPEWADGWAVGFGRAADAAEEMGRAADRRAEIRYAQGLADGRGGSTASTVTVRQLTKTIIDRDPETGTILGSHEVLV